MMCLFLMHYGALQVSIIDFGLAKKYRDPKTHIHIPYRCLSHELLLLFAEHTCCCAMPSLLLALPAHSQSHSTAGSCTCCIC
jgi:hypothetical protein